MTSKNSRDYCAIARQYQEDVLKGRIPACHWVRRACERQKKDLVKQNAKSYQFRFDEQAASRVCRFIELLPHVKGEWAARKELIVLEPWQIFILTCVFGWLDKESGRRRFRVVYTEVPRKNAKSALTSGVALYMLSADGEEGAEVYSAASKREQAKIVYDTARAMVDKLPAMRSALGIQTNSLAIFRPGSNATFRSLAKARSGGGGNHDGLNIHLGIVDELHAHPDSSMWDVLTSGVGARSQPLIWAITTAGHNRAGVCYEQRSYLCKVLDGVANDDRFFGMIWTIDKEDDWRKPDSWIKANPNWGVSVNPEAIESAARKAITLASARGEFMTKHLNVWVNSDSAWMDMQAWDNCADHTLKLEDFTADECIIGADLASKDDFASYVRVFRRYDDDKVAHYYAFAEHYNNEKAVDNNPNPAMDGWAAEGLIHVCKGEATGFNDIEEALKKDCENLRVNEIAFDPHQAWQISQNLKDEGLEVIEYGMNVGNMSEPTKELAALVASGRFHHNGDPVLAWMVSNVVAHTDARDRIFPKREKSMLHQKIDGAIALIIALGRWMQKTESTPTFEVFVI